MEQYLKGSISGHSEGHPLSSADQSW